MTQSKKLWGGRFENNTHPQVDEFNASIHFDKALAQDDIAGSIAHAAMLAECGILKSEEYAELERGLKIIAERVARNEIVWNVADEDVHMNVERLLHVEVGEVAGKLHTARSRNDQVALDMHLYLRRAVLTISDQLLALQETFLALAEEHRFTLLPGYTHLQRAQPIYLGQHFLAYVSMLARDIERLQDSWKRINTCPLGAGALAGSSFPTNPQSVAQRLKFDGIYLNTLDAVSDRDFVVEFLASASLIMMHLSRLSEELILWSSQEFGFITFADAFSTGSSIMPQKKNPDVAELGRGKTGRVYGSLVSLLTILKGLPLAYNKDLQEDKEPVFDTVKTLTQTLSVYIPLLATMKVNTDVMQTAMTEGFLNATALAEYLVKKGMPFRKAHEVTGKLVAYCVKEKCLLESISLQALQKFSSTIEEDIYKVLPNSQVALNQDTGGGARPSRIDQELSIRKIQFSETAKWIAEKEKNLILK